MPPKKKELDPVELARQSENGREPLGTYTFSGGRTVTLIALGEPLLTSLFSDAGKPEAPALEVETAGGGKMLVRRSDDEPFLSQEKVDAIKVKTKREVAQEYREYRLQLQAWSMRRGILFSKTLFLLGVEDGPTVEESAIWRAIGWTDPYDIKYMWLSLLCKKMEDWNDFIEAVVSYAMPTEEGQAEMGEIFQSTMAGPPQPTV